MIDQIIYVQAKKNGKSQKQCDDEFLHNQNRECEKRYSTSGVWWWKKAGIIAQRTACKVAAKAQYALVRAIGHRYLKASKEWCSDSCVKNFQAKRFQRE